MKQQRFVPFALIALLLLASGSCSIEKRLYNKGYHISYHGKGKMAKSNPASEALVSANDSLKTNELNSVAGLPDQQKTRGTTVSVVPATAPPAQQPVIDRPEKQRTSTDDMLVTEEQEPTFATAPDAARQYATTEEANDPSVRKWALIIGISLLLMATMAAIAVPPLAAMFVKGDVAATAIHVTTQFSKFRMSVVGWIVILALDVLAALGIRKYHQKKGKREKLALLTGLLRLIYSVFLGIGIVHLLKVTASSPAASIFANISHFNDFWSWGLIVFGLHLIVLGILFDNDGGKKWVRIAIKVLLISAGVGYIVINLGQLLVPDPVKFVAAVEPIFLLSMLLGEACYALWKIIKGGKTPTAVNEHG